MDERSQDLLAALSDQNEEKGFAAGEEHVLPEGSLRDAAKPERGASALDRQLKMAMDANLRELELMHKREEVEQAELEQAIAMSLALEMKRSELEAQEDGERGCLSDSDDRHIAGRRNHLNGGNVRQTDCKIFARDEVEDGRPQAKDKTACQAKNEAKCDLTYDEEKRFSSGLGKGGMASADLKSLPPLSITRAEGCKEFWSVAGLSGEHFRDPNVEAAGRKRKAREASEKAHLLLEERKRAQEVLQGQISRKKTAERERHLNDLRDRIVSAKRAERDEQALKSETALAYDNNIERQRHQTIVSGIGTNDREDGVLVVNGEDIEEDFANEQRRAMRVALAQRMKHELMENEQNRLAKVQEDQLADLNDKLCLVENLRNQNSEKEAEIAQVLRQQQQQRARNVASSAVYARGSDDDDFTFGERG